MDPQGSDLDRLLRAAARVEDAAPDEMPFGFDTRVVARWRGQSTSGDFGDAARWFRRIGAVAVLVTAVAAIGAYSQLDDEDDPGSPLTNAYAIADTAIETGAWQ